MSLRSIRLRMLVAASLCVLAAAACGERTGEEGRARVTPTPTPVNPSPEPTSTPTTGERARRDVIALFREQLSLIEQDNWAAVYDTCSPDYRSGNSRERFVEKARERFRRAGYTPEGFEARNITAEVLRPGWVSVQYDAFQDGSAVRAVNSGGLYKRASGQWFDDRMWCR
ncbi:MAG: hypothetical protein ACOC5M_03660 [Chloroflexota bacterium]